MSDHIQRFSFAQLPIRGEIISLTETIDTICDQHQYPKEVRHLLAESLAACCLLADIIKIEGRVALQLQSSSVVKLLLVECDNQGRMRGLLHLNEEHAHLVTSEPFDFKQWTANGQMAITIDPDKGQRYQGVVPLDKITLAACLEDYFNMSEQLPTHIKIFADHHKAFGIFIQTLPQAADSSIGNEESQQAFEHVTALTETIKPEEAFELSHQELLYRLFHQDEVSIYPEKDLGFECSCSRERNMAALMTITPAELVNLVEEQNEIEMVCDFCSNKEIFNRQQIMELLTSEADQGVIN